MPSVEGPQGAAVEPAGWFQRLDFLIDATGESSRSACALLAPGHDASVIRYGKAVVIDLGSTLVPAETHRQAVAVIPDGRRRREWDRPTRLRSEGDQFLAVFWDRHPMVKVEMPLPQ